MISYVIQEFEQCLNGKACMTAPYERDYANIIRGYHTTTIVGYGQNDNGRKYWKCMDASKQTQDGDVVQYNIYQGKTLGEFVTNYIQNLIPFKQLQ